MINVNVLLNQTYASYCMSPKGFGGLPDGLAPSQFLALQHKFRATAADLDAEDAAREKGIIHA